MMNKDVQMLKPEQVNQTQTDAKERMKEDMWPVLLSTNGKLHKIMSFRLVTNSIILNKTELT